MLIKVKIANFQSHAGLFTYYISGSSVQYIPGIIFSYMFLKSHSQQSNVFNNLSSSCTVPLDQYIRCNCQLVMPQITFPSASAAAPSYFVDFIYQQYMCRIILMKQCCNVVSKMHQDDNAAGTSYQQYINMGDISETVLGFSLSERYLPSNAKYGRIILKNTHYNSSHCCTYYICLCGLFSGCVTYASSEKSVCSVWV